jgi:hypothetical protein
MRMPLLIQVGDETRISRHAASDYSALQAASFVASARSPPSFTEHKDKDPTLQEPPLTGFGTGYNLASTMHNITYRCRSRQFFSIHSSRLPLSSARRTIVLLHLSSTFPFGAGPQPTNAKPRPSAKLSQFVIDSSSQSQRSGCNARVSNLFAHNSHIPEVASTLSRPKIVEHPRTCPPLNSPRLRHSRMASSPVNDSRNH